MDQYIGQLIVRQDGLDRPAHRVESRIADRLVLRCGREIRIRTDRGDVAIVYDPVRHCKQCG